MGAARVEDFHPAIIGGQQIETARVITSTTPAHPDQVIGRVASCTREQVDQAFGAAREAFSAWSRTLPDERADRLLRLAAIMRCTAPICLDQTLASCSLPAEPSLSNFIGCVTAELFKSPAVVVKVHEVPQGHS